jgi:hypothetical protein
MIHESQVPAVEALVHPHLGVLGGPPAGHGDGRDADPPGGDAAKQVCLVPVTKQHVRPPPTQQGGQFSDGRSQVWGVVGQLNGVVPAGGRFPQKVAAPAALAEADAGGAGVRPEVVGEAEHLPLGAAEQGAGGEVNQAHQGRIRAGEGRQPGV